jgi:hypothetical protein
MNQIAICCLFVLLLQVLTAYECSKNGSKPNVIDKDNKFKLWPGLTSLYDQQHGEALPGLNEV